MLLVWFVLDSPLSQRQCSAHEADCPRLRRLRTKSYNFAQFVCTSQQTQHILSPLTSAHYEQNRHHAPQCMFATLFMEKVARGSHESGQFSSLQNLSMVFSPTLGSIQRPENRLPQFSAHAWLLCHGVFVWQSDVDVANCVCVEVGSTHVGSGNQERVLNSKHVFLTRNTEQDSQSFQRRCCHEKIGSTPSWRTSEHTRRER